MAAEERSERRGDMSTFDRGATLTTRCRVTRVTGEAQRPCQARRVIGATVAPRPGAGDADKTGGGATGRVGVESRCYCGVSQNRLDRHAKMRRRAERIRQPAI